jgi:hypothetical protein
MHTHARTHLLRCTANVINRSEASCNLIRPSRSNCPPQHLQRLGGGQRWGSEGERGSGLGCGPCCAPISPGPLCRLVLLLLLHGAHQLFSQRGCLTKGSEVEVPLPAEALVFPALFKGAQRAQRAQRIAVRHAQLAPALCATAASRARRTWLLLLLLLLGHPLTAALRGCLLALGGTVCMEEGAAR